MPPQFPTKPASSAAVAGVKRPPFLPAASSPSGKMARPASAPCLPALSAAPAPKKRLIHSSATRSAAPRKTAGPRPALREAEAAPCRAAESVHPARRLACGTRVYVRTRYPLADYRCCLLLWLPARVVSSSDAYHSTVKYAACLHAMFAGKIVRVPAADVREAPSSKPAANAKKRPSCLLTAAQQSVGQSTAH